MQFDQTLYSFEELLSHPSIAGSWRPFGGLDGIFSGTSRQSVL